MNSIDGKSILITGGTGSLGTALIRRLLKDGSGHPKKIIVFSRDEAKQHFLRLEYANRQAATDEFIFRNFERLLEFRIGDVRDFGSVLSVLRDADVVVNAAAIKQVPTCEYFPFEAVRTNIEGAENIVRAIHEHQLPIEVVVGVSTDKACKPVNVMGMTKAIQERIFVQGNMRCPRTRFVCVRYGNVLVSRGSVVPLFQEQIRNGGPLTITTPDMTRFLLTLEDAVDTVLAAISIALRGETLVPKVPASRIMDIARVLIGGRRIEVVVTGIRPGEKIHEVLISEEECQRVRDRDRWFGIQPMLPELSQGESYPVCLKGEFSSSDNVMTLKETQELFERNGLMVA